MTQAMEQTGKVAIAKVLIRSKQSLAALRIKDRVLVMKPSSILTKFDPASLNTGIEAVQLNDNEMKMAVNLIQIFPAI